MGTRKLANLCAALLLASAPLGLCETSAALSEAQKVHDRARRDYAAILMWHDIVPGRKDVWFDVTAAELADQFAELKRRNFNAVSLEVLFSHLTTGSPLPPRPVVITFDDTTRGIYTYAFPLLKKYRYPATLFIHTDYVGVRTGKDHCDWDQLKEMQESGLVSVQSHTRTHPADLRPLSDARLNKELLESRQIIEKRLGKPVYAFAYTEGGHDARVRRAVMDAGYKIAIDESWGSAESSRDLAQVHRYSIHVKWKKALADVERAYARRAPMGQKAMKSRGRS
jgi:poly-beta-1,6-N-acetyl-D-glucosamine N-deacetylase